MKASYARTVAFEIGIQPGGTVKVMCMDLTKESLMGFVQSKTFKRKLIPPYPK